MRYLAIYSGKLEASFLRRQSIITIDKITVGNWNIKVQMDTSKPANIQVWE